MEKKLLDAFVALGNSLASAIPRIGVGILLISLGLVVAKLIEVVLRTTLIRVRFDSLTERTGVATALKRIGVRQQLSLLLPKLAYFLAIFLLAKTASDALGLSSISNTIGAFFSYLPNVLAALLLLVLGTTVGQFTGRIVTQAAESWGLDSAAALGKLVSALIIFVVAMMAIGQLKIDTEMVRIMTSFVLGGAALGFGVAFGLGTWNIVRNIATGFYTRKLLAIGNTVAIAGHTGTLVAITPTHTILLNDGHEILIPNKRFGEQTSTHG